MSLNRAERRRLVRAMPKPARRIVSRTAGIQKCAFEGRCRACGRTPTGELGDRLERAHLVGRGVGGDDIDKNIVPLCSKCHRSMHDHDRHWRTVSDAIRMSLTDEETAYVIVKKSLDWLDRTYPFREDA